ncbi:Mu-like prophage major head subunit gpT family protein [Pseudogemmobacter sonorensis]|uniref:Mu-like prophage major head subunit gpT family protein n=1 Tax=Pseudogemmobacter sonorensis TaxID=2989681 RepID=UPI00369ED99A
MDLTRAALAAINVAFTAAFNTSFTGVAPTFQRVAMTVKSTTRHQAYPKLHELGPMREWVGERFVERLEADGFVITNRKFEKTLAVSVDDIADDLIGIHGTFLADMGQTAAELPDELVWEQLEKGFTSEHYDGQLFFDTDHPVVGENGQESSVSNFQGGAGAAWYLVDDSRPVKPIIFQDREPAKIVPKTNLTDENVFNHDEYVWGAKRRAAAGFGAWQLVYASRQPLTPANYALARQAMMSMRGHRGRKLALKPKLLVVSSANEGAAREILLAERNAAGATNVWQNSAELHVETRLTL